MCSTLHQCWSVWILDLISAAMVEKFVWQPFVDIFSVRETGCWVDNGPRGTVVDNGHCYNDNSLFRLNFRVGVRCYWLECIEIHHEYSITRLHRRSQEFELGSNSVIIDTWSFWSLITAFLVNMLARMGPMLQHRTDSVPIMAHYVMFNGTLMDKSKI